MSLLGKINEDIKTAMKVKDTVRLGTLRLLKSAIGNAAIASKVELTELEIIGLIRKEIKKRQETLDSLKNFIRPDLETKESSEMATLQEYLPKSLEDSEVYGIIADAIAEVGSQTKKDMGKIMKIVNEKVAGRADGKFVSTSVQAVLV